MTVSFWCVVMPILVHILIRTRTCGGTSNREQCGGQHNSVHRNHFKVGLQPHS